MLWEYGACSPFYIFIGICMSVCLLSKHFYVPQCHPHLSYDYSIFRKCTNKEPERSFERNLLPGVYDVDSECVHCIPAKKKKNQLKSAQGSDFN